MRAPRFLIALLLLSLAACAGDEPPVPKPGSTEARLRRGLVSVSEDELPAYALDWTPPTVVIEAGDEAAFAKRAEAASKADNLYADAESAIPLWLALLRIDAQDDVAKQGLKLALRRLLEQGDAVLADLGKPDVEIAEAHRIAAVARSVDGESAETLAYLARVDAADRLQAMIEHGHNELAAGRLGESGIGATTAFREVLLARPHDAAALAGLAAVEAVMIERADQAIAADDYAEAISWLDHAASLRPDAPWTVDEARRQMRLKREARVAGLYNDVLRTLDQPHEFGALKRAQKQIGELRGVAIENDWRIARVESRLELASRYGRRRPAQRFSDALEGGGMGPPLVVLPHGEFMMGAPQDEADSDKAEWPQHRVQFQRGFALSRTEITVADFGRFIHATQYRTRADRRGYSVVYDERSGNFVLRNDITWQHDYSGRRASPNLPVIHVDIRDVEAYAEWLSSVTGKRYRLPSEAEFEYALRAGSQSRFPWGEADPPRQTGNLTGARDRSPSGRNWGNAFERYGDGHWGPAPAGSYRANTFGLYDLEGNVSEWVMDCWHVGYRRAPADGGPWYNPGCRSRVVRGASWSSAPAQARSAWRMLQAHDVTNARTGFRVARDI